MPQCLVFWVQNLETTEISDYGYIALFWDRQTSDKLSVISASQYLDGKSLISISLP